MKHMELGGYLPLELNKGKSRFQDLPPDKVLAVNTGRTAIYCAVRSLNARRIHIPYYYCTDVIKMLQDTVSEVLFYHIDQYLMPMDLDVDRDDAVLLVNYFGIMNEAVCAYAKRFQKVILDQSHGYYAKPVLRAGVMNVYSCRKFVGVADGAYIVGEGLVKPDLSQDQSFERALYLCKSMELGTNAAYQKQKEGESQLEQERLTMSKLTGKLLENADDACIVHARRTNFLYLHEKLTGCQRFCMPAEALHETTVPYVYPLLLDHDLHTVLVRQKIYVPVLWNHLLEREWDDTLEQLCARCLLPLPIDQRYKEGEMEYLVHVITKLMKE